MMDRTSKDDWEKIFLGFLAWWRDEYVLHTVGPVSVNPDDYFGDLPEVCRNMIAESLDIIREASLAPYFQIRTEAKLLNFIKREDVQTEDDIAMLVLIRRLMDIYRQGVLLKRQELAELIGAFSFQQCRDYLREYWPDFLPE